MEPEPVVEPEPEPEPVVEGSVWVEPYAGYVPVVHPDTPVLDWGLLYEQVPTPEGLAEMNSGIGSDIGAYMPRPTQGLVDWSSECIGRLVAIGKHAVVANSNCALALNQSVWALDYMGASQDCVVAEMTRQVDGYVKWGTPVFQSERGWFRCPSVIIPDAAGLPHDVELFADEMVRRCREVLPADAELRHYISGAPTDCEGWGISRSQGTYLPLSAAAQYLGLEWMQHHHDAPDVGFGFS